MAKRRPSPNEPAVTFDAASPPTNGLDTRKRNHSGGAWFSVSECPVSFEKVSERSSLVRPEDYKFSRDPMPLTIT